MFCVTFMVWRKCTAMLEMDLFCHWGTLSVVERKDKLMLKCPGEPGCTLGHSTEKKSLYYFVFHHYLLLRHPTAKCASQKCLSMNFNIQRVILPCRDIWWGDPGCAGTDNVRFIKLWQLLSSHLHFPLWFPVQACLSCCQVTGDSKSFSSRHSQDGFFFIFPSLQSPAIIRSS